MRKSKREKEKEAAEAKRREEEANAAKAYAEFIDAFDTDGVNQKKGSSAFVRGGQGSAYSPSARAGAGPSRAPQMFEEDSTVCPKLLYEARHQCSYLFSLRLLLRMHRNLRGNERWTPSWRRLKGLFSTTFRPPALTICFREQASRESKYGRHGKYISFR